MPREITCFVVLVALAAAGCTTTPTLAPGAETKLADGGPGAVASSAGVRVVATVDEWRWNPTDLDQFVTPLLLEVENNTDRPVRIRLKDIRLVGERGVRLAALPPYSVRGEATRTVESHEYAVESFTVAPHLHGYYPGYRRSRHYFYPEQYYYYRAYHPVYRTYSIPLPTQAMLDRALPEGVIQAGGKATGFVYFQRLDRKTAKRTDYLDLLFQVVDAESQKELDVVAIRFDVRS